VTALLVFLIGISLGSFITLASWRLPRGEDIVHTRSRCTACGHALGVRSLLPVLSWVLQRGRCAYCRAGIHWRYPAIELATGVLLLLIYARYGITPMAGVLALLTVMLLIMIVVDFEHYLIPDAVHVALLPLALWWRWLTDGDWADAALGFALGAGIALLLHHGYRRLRGKEGLGFGDVKFFAVAGAWLGVAGMVPFFFFAGMFGVGTALLWRMLKRGKLFPFGPALAAALWMCVVFPDAPGAFWQLQGWLYR
jgi:prepilin signal peptidase PulO-like enzyme (type II secretory pathway)